MFVIILIFLSKQLFYPHTYFVNAFHYVLALTMKPLVINLTTAQSKCEEKSRDQRKNKNKWQEDSITRYRETNFNTSNYLTTIMANEQMRTKREKKKTNEDVFIILLVIHGLNDSMLFVILKSRSINLVQKNKPRKFIINKSFDQQSIKDFCRLYKKRRRYIQTHKSETNSQCH